MDDRPSPDAGWFAGLTPGDVEAAAQAIFEGRADTPRDWPSLAVEEGYTDSEAEYYAWLHEAAVDGARERAHQHELADDTQLSHSLRAMDDCARTANELAERLAEWAGGYYDEADSGVEYARTVAEREPDTPIEERLIALARRVVDLAEERDALRASIERRAPDVAPNLSALAGPVLAARLIALAGGLGAIARKPSGTLQVLGAEDALFAHLRGQAPPPKHGVIYVHEYVSGTRPEDRGSAARALAGKLAIAARVDYYAGDRRPELERELADRIERIRSRGDG